MTSFRLFNHLILVSVIANSALFGEEKKSDIEMGVVNMTSKLINSICGEKGERGKLIFKIGLDEDILTESIPRGTRYNVVISTDVGEPVGEMWLTLKDGEIAALVYKESSKKAEKSEVKTKE